MVIKVKINNASVYRSLSSCQLYKFSNLFFMFEKRVKHSHYIVTVIFQIFIIKPYIVCRRFDSHAFEDIQSIFILK